MRILLTFLTLSISGCGNQGPAFTSPQASDVRSITAVMYDEIDGGEKIERFAIPRSSYEGVLNALSNAKKDSFPPKWRELGDLDISHSTGLLELHLFQTGQQVGAFSVNGTYYRGGSDSEFIGLIKAAWKQSSEQGESGKASPATS